MPRQIIAVLSLPRPQQSWTKWPPGWNGRICRGLCCTRLRPVLQSANHSHEPMPSRKKHLTIDCDFYQCIKYIYDYITNQILTKPHDMILLYLSGKNPNTWLRIHCCCHWLNFTNKCIISKQPKCIRDQDRILKLFMIALSLTGLCKTCFEKNICWIVLTNGI